MREIRLMFFVATLWIAFLGWLHFASPAAPFDPARLVAGWLILLLIMTVFELMIGISDLFKRN
ncbi:MAG: hypothetical protein AAGJ87_01895 [Pseudomonadota bacterium]